jgi:HSP20 family protein
MLTLWRTTHALPSLAAEVNRLMNDVALATPAFTATGLRPPADVLETAQAYQITLDMPGVDPTSIKLSVEKDVLQVSAERRLTTLPTGEELLLSERAFGTLARSFELPTGIDATRVEARYEAGVLTVTLPKREETKARTIPVTVK